MLPESLLDDANQLARVLEQYGLRVDFKINGFANWLPCHQHCNQRKDARMFHFVPQNSFILERLFRVAPSVERTARDVGTNAEKDKLIGAVMAAIERRTMTPDELRELLGEPESRRIDMIHLASGYWLHGDDIARECICFCERASCVGVEGKVQCYFSRYLSKWVITTGLYWRCYDEVIACPRCAQQHKRGHIGNGVFAPDLSATNISNGTEARWAIPWQTDHRDRRCKTPSAG